MLNHLLNELHHFTPSSFSTSIDETCHFGSSFYCNNDDSETHFANQSNAPTSLSKQPTTQQLNKAKDPLNVSNQAKIVASKDPWGLVVDSPDIMVGGCGDVWTLVVWWWVVCADRCWIVN